jgi:hypothetical protein
MYLPSGLQCIDPSKFAEAEILSNTVDAKFDDCMRLRVLDLSGQFSVVPRLCQSRFRRLQ